MSHFILVRADLLQDDLASLLPGEFEGGADLVGLYRVIEHLPKARGLDLLSRCEALARKLVVLETPNGFLPQGPEHGNSGQRHLSGWFIHDFEGLGYTVVGTLDVILSRLPRVDRVPRRAFNLLAYKVLADVAPRLG
jgi:hypothetical protein